MKISKSVGIPWFLVSIISSVYIIIYGAQNNSALTGLGVVLLISSVFNSNYFKK